MKRLMFTLLLAIIYGAIAGVISRYITDWTWAPIVGGICAGIIASITSRSIYDLLFIREKSILQEMGEDDDIER